MCAKGLAAIVKYFIGNERFEGFERESRVVLFRSGVVSESKKQVY